MEWNDSTAISTLSSRYFVVNYIHRNFRDMQLTIRDYVKTFPVLMNIEGGKENDKVGCWALGTRVLNRED